MTADPENGSVRTELSLHPPADGILDRALPALRDVFGSAMPAIGGGAALIARWRHRTSADLDLFATPDVLCQRCPALAWRLAAAGFSDVRHPPGQSWLTASCAAGQISLFSTPPPLPHSVPDAVHEGTGAPVETEA